MKVIAKRIWTEPAVAIGLLTSTVLLILAIITNSFDASSIAGIVAPFLSSLGIRQLVSPVKDESQRTTS